MVESRQDWGRSSFSAARSEAAEFRMLVAIVPEVLRVGFLPGTNDDISWDRLRRSAEQRGDPPDHSVNHALTGFPPHHTYSFSVFTGHPVT